MHVPGDWSHVGGLVQSEPVQQELELTHPEPHTFCPAGQVQPAVVQICVPVHAGAPLHVHVPLSHAFVVVPPQSLLVQHCEDAMHVPLQGFWPAGHAHPEPVHTSPEVHGMEPLQVHVPALHVFVVVPAQSLLVQQLDDGMHPLPHFL